jgi:molybdopterin-guanine dinucleotide biosynthesis protein A
LSQPDFSGAVLVGGRSSRMGTDKALVEVDGVPMAARVANALVEAGAAAVTLVGGQDRGLQWRHVQDLHPGDGPLGGIVTALTAADLPTDVVVAVACDLAWLDAPTVAAVVGGLADGADVAFAHTDRRQPLCAAWRRSSTAELLRRAFDGGERAPHRAVAGLICRDVPVAAGTLRNVNAPEDLCG